LEFAESSGRGVAAGEPVAGESAAGEPLLLHFSPKRALRRFICRRRAVCVAHALVGLLFVVLLIAHGVVSHRKIVQTTRHVTCKSMSKEARIDCCLGLAMVAFLAIVLVSGGSLMHARMAECLNFDETAGTPAFVAHICGAVLFLLCALAHVWINRERLEKLLNRTGEKD
jgi:threonine/homoserine/homoserine lactone efflux protein